MDKRQCGACALWLTPAPGAFDGQCSYFPPQLAIVDGKLANVRPSTTRDEGCHIGYRPRECLPALVALAQAAAEGRVPEISA